MAKKHNFYDLRIWRDRLRPDQLIREPLCRRCGLQGKAVPAEVVNHIVPHKGDYSKFVNPDNLESVCKPCHDGYIQREEHHGYGSMIGADGWPMDRNHPINKGR